MFEHPVVRLVAIVCMIIVAVQVLKYFRNNPPLDGWMALVWGALLSVSMFAAIIYLPMAWGGWGVLAIIPLSLGLIYLAIVVFRRVR
jgi:hypothetical protein